QRAMASRLPADRLRVAESGLKDAATLLELYDAGFRAFLVGEHFATAPEPEAAVRSFVLALAGHAGRSGGGRP
ncbi:MAG TPA: hypothetical protein VFL04_04855, partial [Rectinemataceae bacterium]|nr:hypothetical protein [Rectinemataceae bacterium]